MIFETSSTSTRQAKKDRNSNRGSSVTILTKQSHFQGKLFCQGSTRVAGKIDGEIVSKGLLIIEKGAMITAKITADEAIIQGKVKGSLTATESVNLETTSHFSGDITTPSLVVCEGAIFNGQTSMGNNSKDLSEGKEKNSFDYVAKSSSSASEYSLRTPEEQKLLS